MGKCAEVIPQEQGAVQSVNRCLVPEPRPGQKVSGACGQLPDPAAFLRT